RIGRIGEEFVEGRVDITDIEIHAESACQPRGKLKLSAVDGGAADIVHETYDAGAGLVDLLAGDLLAFIGGVEDGAGETQPIVEGKAAQAEFVRIHGLGRIAIGCRRRRGRV